MRALMRRLLTALFLALLSAWLPASALGGDFSPTTPAPDTYLLNKNDDVFRNTVRIHTPGHTRNAPSPTFSSPLNTIGSGIGDGYLPALRPHHSRLLMTSVE
jgi:hypothetical protein